MGKSAEKPKIPVEIEYTEGYQERFTTAILKIYERRLKQDEQGREGKDNKSA